MNKYILPLALLVVGLGFGFWFGQGSATEAAAAAAKTRVFEMRTYYTNEGKLPDLEKRFREHTTKIFKKHGMTNVGYWVPQDSPKKENTLIYIISHKDRETAKLNWDNFRKDPEWQAVAKASEVNGKIVSKVDSVFMDSTDYSPIK
jgi:NIPSNAP